MYRRLFIDHPRSVDESYSEHFMVAARFGITMIWGGLGALIHAVIPGWCVTAGSDTVRRLNAIMVEQRGRKQDAAAEMHCCEWII